MSVITSHKSTYGPEPPTVSGNKIRSDHHWSATRYASSGRRPFFARILGAINNALESAQRPRAGGALLDHLATFHNEGHLLHVLDVGERVAIDSNNVGELSSLEAADLVR